MPSSTSKQISYPCPVIGNEGDYQSTAKMDIDYAVEKFPKKIIFRFYKPSISDTKIQNLFDEGQLSFFVELNSPATFSLICKELDFNSKNKEEITFDYGVLNNRVRVRFFLSSIKELDVAPTLLANDYPKRNFIAKELNILGKSKSKFENIPHRFDPFEAEPESIFLITPNTNKTIKEPIHDFTQEKILIKLPEDTFKQYQSIKRKSLGPFIYNNIVLPALQMAIHYIEILKSAEEKLSEAELNAQIEYASYVNKGWFNNLCELIDENNLQGTPFEKANKILKSPLISLIKSKYEEHQSQIDDEILGE